MAISKIVTNSINDAAITTAKIADGVISPGRAFVFKPTITSPANNSTNITDVQLITASPFLSLYGIAQANAEWQLSTNSQFAFINVASTINGSNTQFQINSSSGLVTSNTYYARVRYSDTSNNSSDYSDTIQFSTADAFSFTLNYLVIAGGGGGGGDWAGGGGAGGYRTSAGPSGGGAAAEPALTINVGTSYTVTVGAGGPGSTYPGPAGQGFRGSNSVFHTISSFGGGGGGGDDNPDAGQPGGSGGGGGIDGLGAAGTPNQGYAGGNGNRNPQLTGGGGGGAGGIGIAGVPGNGGDGGPGVASSITGTPVIRGGGGGGGSTNGTGVGGAGGGGNGSTNAVVGTEGSPNTGGGGGGSISGGRSGCSGVVIIRYP